jgi:hypothetical protein
MRRAEAVCITVLYVVSYLALRLVEYQHAVVPRTYRWMVQGVLAVHVAPAAWESRVSLFRVTNIC